MVDVSCLIGTELNISQDQVRSTIALLDQSCTIPFISRYRKEATGGLDEVAVGDIAGRLTYFRELDARRQTVIETIESQGAMTAELRDVINSCTNHTKLEDIYLPYKPRRRTRASIARERGLEPLALEFISGSASDIVAQASADDVQGASDIIAEWVSETAAVRDAVRGVFARKAVLSSSLAKGAAASGALVESGDKYKNYYDFSQPLARVPSHRLMAIMRGQREGVLRVVVDVEDTTDIVGLCVAVYFRVAVAHAVSVDRDCCEVVRDAVEDGYRRLIKPSIESEFLAAAKERADLESIRVFSSNLRQLLLESPLGERRTMGIDPGFRTGCKVVCLDAQGNLLHHDVFYLHQGGGDTATADKCVRSLVERYGIEAIAIGNGTAGREAEALVREVVRDCRKVAVYSVNEDGASIYSASEVAREELGEYDLTVRGAASIGRRLMDPLAELVKIDPKSIGVGQYQHDVDQKLLKQSLGAVVESCVNSVGVNLNTASKHLLGYISGLNNTVAANIVAYRAEHGAFGGRRELLSVPRLGAKVYEQAAGFLRIQGGGNVLDSTAVHPESYGIVEQMAADAGVSVARFIEDKELRKKINFNHYVSKGVGILTITAIMNELNREGRDSRQEFANVEFTPGIETINDLKEGMVVKGIVTNITNFGAFVNIGVKQDGLVHISQMANRYVANPSDVVTLKQEVMVKITEIDYSRGRIGLSMKALLEQE